MARFARVVAPGVPHHLTHRGNRREQIFFRDEDRRVYLSFLREYAASSGLDLWGYCLMTNHIHLIVVPRAADSLARGVGLAHRRYAVWLNGQQRRTGHLWANRFFSTPLDEAHHWAAIRYVERNPVEAKMVKAAEDYPWSSARAHALGEADPLLTDERPYPGPIKHWAAWLREPEEEELLARIQQCTQTGRPCGGEGFIRQLERALSRNLTPAKRGPKPKTDDA